jgi:hypothetical protein
MSVTPVTALLTIIRVTEQLLVDKAITTARTAQVVIFMQMPLCHQLHLLQMLLMTPWQTVTSVTQAAIT